MADDSKLSFPTMPAKHWWALREKFRRGLPGTVTTSYLETVLDVNRSSALEMLSALKSMKIIDNEGKTGDRAERWRHDDTYADVCKEIREELYPAELLSAVPDPSENRKSAERWFAKTAKVGDNRSLKMAITYQLLVEADITKKQDVPTRSASKNTGTPSVKKTKAPKVDQAAKSEEDIPENKEPTIDVSPPTQSLQLLPALHIDIQIHISHEATPEQIDAIFASMGKHLYKHE